MGLYTTPILLSLSNGARANVLPFMMVITFVPGGSRVAAVTLTAVLWLVGCDCVAIISCLLLSVRTVPFLPIVPLISSLPPTAGTCTMVVVADVGSVGAMVVVLYTDLATVPTTALVMLLLPLMPLLLPPPLLVSCRAWLGKLSAPLTPPTELAAVIAIEVGPVPLSPLLIALDVTFRFSGIVWMAGEPPAAVDVASSCEWAMPTIFVVPFAPTITGNGAVVVVAPFRVTFVPFRLVPFTMANDELLRFKPFNGAAVILSDVGGCWPAMLATIPLCDASIPLLPLVVSESGVSRFVAADETDRLDEANEDGEDDDSDEAGEVELR